MPPPLTRPTLLLLSLGLLTACAKTPEPVPIAADKLCQSWRHQTITKADQLADSTAAQIEGNNAARTSWGCSYGSNRAKAPANG